MRVCLCVCVFFLNKVQYNCVLSLTNSRGSRVAGRGSRVQCRGRGSNVAAGENDLGFEVTAE